MMRQLQWCQKEDQQLPIIKVPLLFTFPPVETLMKELTKLNSPHVYRISYLGPRWADSVLFHKKYSNNSSNYPFSERKISKNNSFLNSMLNNQFYKNQIFYRAFEGMNPTLNLQQQLLFQSRFEGGNLDCVVKVNEFEYDLFLRIDSNTRGNIFWFYFIIRNCTQGKKIKFNICNLTKTDTHYSKGLNPFMYSSVTKEWSQEGMTNVTFKQKKLRYDFLYERLRLRKYFELSFQVEFKGEEELKFAYCIPYTYSDLMKDLKKISSVAEVGSLGQSLTGVNIPIVMIGKHEQNIQKQVLLITGRIHPGESNGSLIVGSLMRYLCFSPEAKFMREKVITIIVPMINPDGVILGNSRCGASGKDLNREFTTKAKTMFPQITHIKNLVDKISETHELQVYLDFHGHSRKKSMFIFGPSYNITQPEYYKCRVFPKLLSNVTNIFRYYSCSYDIPNDKRSTARGVMLSEMMIPFVYTVQSSLGFYHDYSLHKDLPFSKKKWQQIGDFVGLALKEYYEGVEQYEMYIEAKKNAKKLLNEELKRAYETKRGEDIRRSDDNKRIEEGKRLQEVHCEEPVTVDQMPLKIKEGKYQLKEKELRELKILKLFQEIKQIQSKRLKQQKKQKQKNRGSDDDSDSHNEQQQFEKQKMRQFSGMVTQFVEQQIQKSSRRFYLESPTLAKKKFSLQHQKKKQIIQKKRQLKRKDDQLFMMEQIQPSSSLRIKRKDIRTESKQRSISLQKRQDANFKIEKEEQNTKNFSSFRDQQIQGKDRLGLMGSKEYLQQQIDFISVEKKMSNKLNIRMFNFSKMVQNPRSGRYQDVKQKQMKFIKKDIEQQSDCGKSLQVEYPMVNKTYYNQLDNIAEQQELGRAYNFQLQQSLQKKYVTEDPRHPKVKTPFPPSFYRIKYHNNQRRKQQTKKEKQLSDFEQFHKISNLHGRNLTTNFTAFKSTQLNFGNETETEERQEKKDKLIIQMRKYPTH